MKYAVLAPALIGIAVLLFPPRSIEAKVAVVAAIVLLTAFVLCRAKG